MSKERYIIILFPTGFYPSKIKICKWSNEQFVRFTLWVSIEKRKAYGKSEDFVETKKKMRFRYPKSFGNVFFAKS
jgi:hypothetical protein